VKETRSGIYLLVRYLVMFFGLSLLSLGILLSVRALLGVSAWTVFHLGIAKHIGWTQGQVSQVVGLGIILVSLLLGIRPAVATILNMFLVGRIYDWLDAANLVSTPAGLLGRYGLLLLSVWVMAAGTALYISVSLGAGPRDSLMLALTKRSGWRIGWVRNGIELGVLLAGALLGGPVGLGTLLFAFGIGPALEFNLQLLRVAREKWHLQAILTVVESKKRRKAEVKTGQATA